MSKLDKIEADLHRHARRSDPPVFQDHGDLLIRAVRQLGALAAEGKSQSLLKYSMGGSFGHLHEFMELYDAIDPDVLDLIAPNQERVGNE